MDNSTAVTIALYERLCCQQCTVGVPPLWFAPGRMRYIIYDTALAVIASMVGQFRDNTEKCLSHIAESQRANPVLDDVLQTWVDDKRAAMDHRLALWHEVIERLQRLEEAYKADEARDKAVNDMAEEAHVKELDDMAAEGCEAAEAFEDVWAGDGASP